MDSAEYDVIWNGAHHGRNADLLCDGLRLASVSVEPVARSVTEFDEPARLSRDTQLALVSAALSASNLTHQELMRQTGLSFCQCKHALASLRGRQQLGFCTHRPAGGRYVSRRGRQPLEYWLRQRGEHD